MGAVYFLALFLVLLTTYPVGCFLVWLFKYRKKMTFDEFERRFDL